jgi:hypothetical protein
VALLSLIGRGYKQQFGVVIEEQDKDIPSRLEMSVSFLKEKLLGFMYWKR